MADAFETNSTGLSSPIENLFSVTPDNDNDLAHTTRAINVAVAGNVSVVTKGGDTGTINVAAGIPFPIRAVRIRATGTTATGIVGLY